MVEHFGKFQFIVSLEESIHIFILLYCDYNQRRRIVQIYKENVCILLLLKLYLIFVK